MKPSPPSPSAESYWLTRFVILRLLGFVYAIAFWVSVRQILPLIGSHGLLPVGLFLGQIQHVLGLEKIGFWQLPSLFWWNHSDMALQTAAWIGFVLSILVMAGYANALTMATLWILYMSFVHVGQDWYGYGWEIQLLETGFLGIFLCPLLDVRPFPKRPPPLAVLWLFRWLIFRIMLGSALIKLRGDQVWRNLTALYYHFQTQPIPNPLSRWFYFLPHWLLKIGVLFNFLAELVAPWFVFTPRITRSIAGIILVLFQLTLMASGNLSFLNWLTITPALACFDDCFWAKILPRRWVESASMAQAQSQESRPMRVTSWVLTALVLGLSIQPVLNLVSSNQIMNTSFNAWDIVNTYGAFGSVGKVRLNIVFEGTEDHQINAQTLWKAYPYRALPVALNQRPPQIAPYQPRLDWQMWFAAMGTPDQYPWTLHLVWKLLHNDPGTLSLLGPNPFPQHPPYYIRALLYQYQFAPPGNPEGYWWKRKILGQWLPPLSASNPQLLYFLKEEGWLTNTPFSRLGREFKKSS